MNMLNRWLRCAYAGSIGVAAVLILITGADSLNAAAAPPSLTIAQVPLTVAIPAHPQVVLALGNSESMDGDLSGAIRTGSGSLGSGSALLTNSSSPTNYTVPAGFCPATSWSVSTASCSTTATAAAYTAACSGNLCDNGPSRLNVAKQGISSIIDTFIPSVDFALVDYNTGGATVYTTWVYEMSPTGGNFGFTSTPGSQRYVANPCLNYQSLSSGNSIYQDCNAIGGLSGNSTTAVNSSSYMTISKSSDDPDVNDVLYAGGQPPIFLTYGGPSPASEFPPNFSLANFNANNGTVRTSYSNTAPSIGSFATFPTNAGFVPASPQVMYIQRGFGYGASQSSNSGNVAVSMKSAGQTPTSTSTTNAINAFASYLAPETNSSGTGEIKASAGQSALAGLLSGTQTYFNTNPATTNGCTAQKYVVLVTDGLPTLDLSGGAWPPLGTAAAAGFGVTATFNTDGSLATTNDQALTDTITTLTNLKTAGIKTYVIGLGAGVDPALNPTAANTLQAMAIAGGTGSYYAATSPAALTSSLQVILANILATTQSLSATSVNTTGFNSSTQVYQASFTTADTYQDWTGTLYSFPINANGTVNTTPSSASWSAAAKIDGTAASSRLIATWDPSANSGAGGGIPFEWASSGTTGITPSTVLGTKLTVAVGSVSDTNGSDRLSYLRGDASMEVRNGGGFRNRAHRMGDVINSGPSYVAQPSSTYGLAGYATFANTYKNRSPMIYVGANDGMLHAFDARTGAEKFAYIPNGVYANLPLLLNPYYNAQHRYFVDGSPQVGDVQFTDSTWHTILVGGENAGGNTIYALDVTNPAGITSESTLASSVLWEFSDSTGMGNSFSTPQIANTNDGFLVFFGNGYNSTLGQPIFYAVNPKTGAQVAKINLCVKVPSACSATAANGLSTIALANTGGSLFGAVTVAYAGDLQGNLWRIDVSDPNPANWTVSVMFQARDPSSNAQPITVQPEVTLNPAFPRVAGTMVYFGTGQLLQIADLATTQVQTVYGVYDPLSTSLMPYTRSNLQGQTATAITGTSNGQTINALSVTGTAVSLSATGTGRTKGWYVDLSYSGGSGTRQVTNPVLADGVLLITTYDPNSNSCVGGGSAYLLALNFISGLAFAQPELSLTGSSAPGAADVLNVNGTNVVPGGVLLGTVYATAGTVLSSNGSNLLLIATSGGPARACANIGTTTNLDSCKTGVPIQHRTGWWEIR